MARVSPVWKRLLETLDPAARLLVIVGPQGSGRGLLAHHWVAGGGKLVDLRDLPPGTTAADAADQVLAMLERHSGARVAAVLPPAPPVFVLAHRSDAQLVQGPDLFLTVAEVERLAADRAATVPEHPRNQPVSPEQIWRRTGGWLHGVEALLADPSAEPAVSGAMGRAMTPWISHLDADGLLPETAFLPFFSQDLLDAFFAPRVDRIPDLARLAEACLLRQAPDGEWIMPDLARKELRASLARRSPERAEELDALAVAALATVSEPGAAVITAVERRAWTGLWSVLEENWVDMFISNPRMLRYAAQKMPARFARSDFFSAALKLLAAAGKDRMNVPFPAVRPDYAEDRTAQNLRRFTEEQFRRPGTFALTAGLVELSYLRVQGHYEESGRFAERLRRAVNDAAATERVRPLLTGMAELHAGISLHIADCPAAAAIAYEAAMRWGADADSAFLQANAAANLAMLHACSGNTQAARDWADRAEGFVDATRWGRDMVGRGLLLSRAYIAWHELDRNRMEQALARLPEEPDNDEFWPLHAELLTLRDRFFGSADAVLHRVQTLRGARPYASSSPLARRALGHAEVVARAAVDPLGVPKSLAVDSPELRNVQAYLSIQTGDTDAALAMLQRVLSDREAGWRPRCLARNLQLLAVSVPGPLSDDAVGRVRENHAAGGELIDLLWLWQVRENRDALRRSLELSDEDVRRLDRYSAARRERVEDREPLTEMELEVLAGLRLGRTRSQMAAMRHVSVNTVKAQTSSLYRKLGAANRNEALLTAKLWGY